MAKDKRLVIGFIDDDNNELEIFKKVFKDDFLIFSSSRVKPVLDEIKVSGNKPNLFVLDLYFPRGRNSTQAEHEKMVHLKQKVEQAEKELFNYLFSIEQDKNGGIELIPQIRKKYRDVPIIFYTRKGTLKDVDACRDAGASYVLKKPHPIKLDPSTDIYSQLEESTRKHKDALSRQFEKFASSKTWHEKVFKFLKFIWVNWKKF